MPLIQNKENNINTQNTQKIIKYDIIHNIDTNQKEVETQ